RGARNPVRALEPRPRSRGRVRPLLMRTSSFAGRAAGRGLSLHVSLVSLLALGACNAILDIAPPEPKEDTSAPTSTSASSSVTGTGGDAQASSSASVSTGPSTSTSASTAGPGGAGGANGSGGAGGAGGSTCGATTMPSKGTAQKIWSTGSPGSDYAIGSAFDA